jgi:hypothetical protein
MRLYLDEDAAGSILLVLLRRAGHDVQGPRDARLVGRSDVVQFTYAVHNDRVALTRNYCDFHDLHNLLEEAQGHHPGILVIRRDNDPRRNLLPRDTVRAIRNLEAAGLPLADHYHILNSWR